MLGELYGAAAYYVVEAVVHVDANIEIHGGISYYNTSEKKVWQEDFGLTAMSWS
jgi:hypothetical protein